MSRLIAGKLLQVFLLNIVLFLTTRQEDVGSAIFDKDDSLAVEFVTAASNLRSSCYNIRRQSLFNAKVYHDHNQVNELRSRCASA